MPMLAQMHEKEDRDYYELFFEYGLMERESNISPVHDPITPILHSPRRPDRKEWMYQKKKVV